MVACEWLHSHRAVANELASIGRQQDFMPSPIYALGPPPRALLLIPSGLHIHAIESLQFTIKLTTLVSFWPFQLHGNRQVRMRLD